MADRRRKPDTRPLLDPGAVEKLFGEKAPHSLEAEMAVLGSILLDPACIGDVADAGVCREAFYSEQHAAIYDAVATMHAEHESDLLRVMDRMRDKGTLELAGGSEYLMRLAESVPSAANAGHYATIVAGHWHRRRLIDAAGEMIYDAFHDYAGGPGGAGELLDKAESRIYAITSSAEKRHAPSTLGAILQDAIDASEARTTSGKLPILTGFEGFDAKTAGLEGGDFIVLAARPSQGKSSLALNILERVAAGVDAMHTGREAQPPVPCLLFSMEMNKGSIAGRHIVGRARVSMQKWKGGRLNADEWRKVIHVAGEFAEFPLFVDDSPTLTITQLRSRARKMVARHKIGLIAVDYLQLMSAPSDDESRQVEVSAISRGLKALARELGVPIIVMAQLNRGVEQRESKRPRMSDIRESGSVEQDADVICLLHREEYYHQDDDEWLRKHPEHAGKAELIIAKQRNGPTGIVHLKWNNEAMTFTDDDGLPEYQPAPTGKAPKKKVEQLALAPETPAAPDPDDEDDSDIPY